GLHLSRRHLRDELDLLAAGTGDRPRRQHAAAGGDGGGGPQEERGVLLDLASHARRQLGVIGGAPHLALDHPPPLPGLWSPVHLPDRLRARAASRPQGRAAAARRDWNTTCLGRRTWLDVSQK